MRAGLQLAKRGLSGLREEPHFLGTSAGRQTAHLSPVLGPPAPRLALARRLSPFYRVPCHVIGKGRRWAEGQPRDSVGPSTPNARWDL